MQVVILCGGLGTRLREETEFRPKPMVKIGSRPILWHIMKIYAHHGFRDFILTLGYRGESIKEYFQNYELINNDMMVELGRPGPATCLSDSHDEHDWRVILSNTGEAAQKGARLKRIERYVEGDEFLVAYGDGVADLDVARLIDFHRSHGRVATVTGVNPTSRFGELEFEGDRVTQFVEKPTTSPGDRLISGGFFVFDRRIFEYLSDDDACDLEYGALERLAEEGELMLYRHTGFWACMDNLRDMAYLNRLWSEGRAEWKIWSDSPRAARDSAGADRLRARRVVGRDRSRRDVGRTRSNAL